MVKSCNMGAMIATWGHTFYDIMVVWKKMKDKKVITTSCVIYQGHPKGCFLVRERHHMKTRDGNPVSFNIQNKTNERW